MSVPSAIDLYDKIKLEASAAQIIQDIHLTKQLALYSGDKAGLMPSLDQASRASWSYVILSYPDKKIIKQQTVQANLQVDALNPTITYHPKGHIEHQGSLHLSRGRFWIKLIYLHSGHTHSKKSW